MNEMSRQNLVNLDALRLWMDGIGLGSGPIKNACFLSGGTQNILLSFERSGGRYVLRRPPAHPTSNGNTTMRREIQLLRALAGTEVPHTRLIAGCDDEEVLGAVFYLMEEVEGFNATVTLPKLHARKPEFRRRMGFALMDGALALSRVDYKRVGLESFGSADGFLDRQVSRWLAQLDSYAKYDAWPGPSVLPGVNNIGKWLDDNRPATFSPGIMHGDYHLFNVMFRNDSPKLAAIMDWELTTIGDPLLDLGVVLAGWPEGEDQPAGQMVMPWDGFPSVSELIKYYAERSDRDVSMLLWYRVLACFKIAILIEGTHARAGMGLADRITGEKLHSSACKLLRRAERLIGEN